MKKRSGTGSRKWWWVSAALLAVIVLVPFGRLLTTVRLLNVVRRVAAGDDGAGIRVYEERVARFMGDHSQSGVVYRLAGTSPANAVLLIPGVSELGNFHPRLVALARTLAAEGFLVITPDIQKLREFRIFPPPLDEISFWLQEARKVSGGEKVTRLGLMGISFSGTLALIAAAQPENRDLVAYVLAVGAFDDLMRCSPFWFNAGPVTVEPGNYPTRFYARWILMMAAIDLLPAAEDRQFLETALRDLLLQKQVPPVPASITEAGRRWLILATMREDEADPDLAQKIENRAAALLYPALSTTGPAAGIRCPVFLAHGAYDDLVPPEESLRLKAKITQAKSYLLVSPFLTHTHSWEKPLGWRVKIRAGFNVCAFFYRLSAVM